MIAVLTATGDITDERRQEFILWSDALGLSMLVDALAHELPPGATESTVLGPFYVPGSPRREYGESMVIEAGRRRRRPGSTAGCSTPRRPDRRRRARRVAERRRHALRGPAPGGRGGPPARPLPDPRRRHLRVRRRPPGPVPDPRRRPGGADARRHRPASVASGPHPHDRARARLQDRHHPRVRRRPASTSTPTPCSRSSTDCCGRSSSAPPTIPTRPPAIDGDWVSLENDIVLAPGEAGGAVVDPGRTA